LETPALLNVPCPNQRSVALTCGLEDGTRIEKRQDGWVVVDRHGFYLENPEDAAWVADADDEDMPALSAAAWAVSWNVVAPADLRMGLHTEVLWSG
jgi:sirohydrochlorin ferrochelatase